MKAPFGPEFNFPPQQPPLPPKQASPQYEKSKEEIEKEEHQKMIDEMYKDPDHKDLYR